MPEVISEVIETVERQILGPHITVDRALNHFITDIDIDVVDLVSFYDELPYENKPPLDELVIHFSAAAVESDDIVHLGTMLWKGTKEEKVTATPALPETDTPTLIIYGGSALLELDDAETISELLSDTCKHELSHYAQGEPEQTKDTTRLQKIGNRAIYHAEGTMLGLIIDKAWLPTGAASFAAAELLTNEGLDGSLKVAIGAAVIRHIMGTNRRRQASVHRGHDLYEAKEREVEARQFEKHNAQLVSIQLADYDSSFLKGLTVRETSRFSQWFAAQLHTKLALSPPSSLSQGVLGLPKFPKFKSVGGKRIDTK